MSVPQMLVHLLLERCARRLQPRTPETNTVMAAPGQVSAFAASGRDAGLLGHLYFFHAVMSLPVIRPGDVVLDLACGPANQLAHIARLHPQTRFIGIDASEAMIRIARDTLASAPNASVQCGDITQLSDIAPHSVDGVLCTMSLHHLPDISALDRTMREIHRVLKNDGGVYLADFGRLKYATTQHYFALDRASEQSQEFTGDFWQSMRAAFSVGELRAATAALDLPLSQYSTAMADFLVIFRSASRASIDAATAARVARAYRELTRVQQRDFDNLVRWFRLGGMPLPNGINPVGGES
jgi:SAM-dependent methyltransferase